MLAETIARLVDQLGELRGVQGAADLAAVQKTPPAQVPWVFVVPLEDAAEGDGRMRGSTQTLRERVGIVLVQRSAKGDRGEGLASDGRTLRDAVRGALLGWSPDTGCDAYRYIGGRTLSFAGTAWWYLLTFETARRLDKAAVN
ncbi:MAG: hypothetical protein KDH20_02020 [Rhodocyclaceae bacterium]|nr:hypothetical protein [Gammaproteobacteria bacterium]MCB1886359.1 hypothetical protein [Rhodocyclaceae bacterium]